MIDRCGSQIKREPKVHKMAMGTLIILVKYCDNPCKCYDNPCKFIFEIVMFLQIKFLQHNIYDEYKDPLSYDYIIDRCGSWARSAWNVYGEIDFLRPYFSIMKVCPCNIQNVFFRRKNYKFHSVKILIFLIFLLKTYIVGTCQNRREAVLTSTHNVCFGSKIRKLGIPLHTAFFFSI